MGLCILQTKWTEASIIISNSVDPWHNLAVEEMLLHGTLQTDTILYLWQNQNTVVIGRNQNAWKECRWELLHEEGGKLARRLSGGGAVYHDLGNLNFTFITSRRAYDLDKQLQVILGAVEELGIPAEFSGRNDLLAAGRKFSGNAFYKDGNRAYHHGTILVDVDFAQMGRYLEVSKEKMATKGIDSIESRVVNLVELNPHVHVGLVRDQLIKSFRRIYAPRGGEVVLDGGMEMGTSQLPELYGTYASWEWRFGETPDFDLMLEHRFPWGGVELALKLERGRIQKAQVFSDAMEPELMLTLGPALQGCIFQKNAMLDALGGMGDTSEELGLVEDIKAWLAAIRI